MYQKWRSARNGAVPEMAHLAQYNEFIGLKLFLSKFFVFILIEPSDFDKMAETWKKIHKNCRFECKSHDRPINGGRRGWRG